MGRTDFEERKQARIDRLRKRAEAKRQEAERRQTSARERASVIPFGQPILVGHHSEGRDRRYRAGIDRDMRKGFELSKEAAELDSRANAAERNDAIMSDDPTAIEQLQAKIDKAQEKQELMKAVNKLVRKGDTEATRAGLRELGLSDATIDKLHAGDYVGRKGFPSYELTNNSANIRRMKKRLATLEAQADDVTDERTWPNGVRVVDNVEDNRLQIFFPERLSKDFYRRVRSHGFRWARTLGCFQRHRSNSAMYYGKELAETYPGD